MDWMRGKGMVLAAWLVSGGALAWGQWVERERDVTITGPRGRTVERRARTERGPGGYERELEVRRPGAERQVRVEARPGGVSREMQMARPGATIRRDYRVERRGAELPPPGYYPPPPAAYRYGPRPGVVVERQVVVERPRPLAIRAPFFNMFIGTPPPPPVVVVPEPVYVTPPPVPPTVIYQPPQPYVAPQPPQTVVVDPVAQEIARLQSHHDDSREEATRVLGRLRDPRAVPALIDRLKYDEDKEVRMNAAWALGEIGDPQGAAALDLAAVYDKKNDVRQAAALAATRLARVEVAPPAQAAPYPEVPAYPTAPPASAYPTTPPPPPSPDSLPESYDPPLPLPPPVQSPGFGSPH